MLLVFYRLNWNEKYRKLLLYERCSSSIIQLVRSLSTPTVAITCARYLLSLVAMTLLCAMFIIYSSHESSVSHV